MKYHTYTAPFHSELRAEGWLPTDISKQSKDAIYKAMTLYGSNYAKYMEWYRSFYGNTLEPARRMLAVYTYGHENLQQFGGDMRYVIYQGYRHVIKDMMHRYNKYSGFEPMRSRIPSKAKHIESLIEIVSREMHEDAMKHIDKMNGKIVEPKKEYKKKRKKKPDEYKIMRLADRYD